MPTIFTLITNLPDDRITTEILKLTSKLLAEIFDITEKNVLISIKSSVPMLWGNKSGFYGLGTVQNFNGINAEVTKNMAPQIFEFIEMNLGIPKNRLYIGFITINPASVACQGRTYLAMRHPMWT